MSANKCCCCRLLSCFACFSDKKTAKPDSSEIAASSLNVVANASPAAALKVESSEIAPFALNVSSSSQPTVTSVASPTSSPTIVSSPAHPVGPSSPTIASPPAHPRAHDKRIQGGSSSAPSTSSVQKDPDHTTNKREAHDAVDIENVAVDLNELINYISGLLDFIKEKKKGNNPSKPKAARYHWPGSKSVLKLREVLSEGINVVKDVCPDVKTIAQGFLKGMGAAHMATTGLLVVANILERYEAISTNEEHCLSILEEMNILTRYVKKLLERRKLKEDMEDSIREAIVLIVEASVACCTQMDASKFSS